MDNYLGRRSARTPVFVIFNLLYIYIYIYSGIIFLECGSM